jgi:hypothetical protein
MSLPMEIIPNVWLGNLKNALNTNFKETFNITKIIKPDKDLFFLGKSENYNFDVKNRIQKYEIDKLIEYILEVTEFMNVNLINNNGILVVGENSEKSAVIILSYIIRYSKIPQDQAKKILSSKYNILINNYDFTLKKIQNYFNY